MPTRLPPLGPFVPSLAPVLILVTEAHVCNVHYLNPQREHFQEITASLLRASTSSSADKSPAEPIEGAGGSGRCTHAAIGLGYDGKPGIVLILKGTLLMTLESSILISTYSRFVPPLLSKPYDPLSLGPNLEVPLSFDASEDPILSSEYDSWRDHNIVQVCEVNILVQGFGLRMSLPAYSFLRSHYCFQI